MTTPTWAYQGLGYGSTMGPVMNGASDQSGVGVSLAANIGGGAPPSNAVGMAIVLGGLVILYMMTRNIQGSR